VALVVGVCLALGMMVALAVFLRQHTATVEVRIQVQTPVCSTLFKQCKYFCINLRAQTSVSKQFLCKLHLVLVAN